MTYFIPVTDITKIPTDINNSRITSYNYIRSIAILHTSFIFKELYMFFFIEHTFKDVKFFVRITRQYILFLQSPDTEVFLISHSDGDILCLPVIAWSFHHCSPIHRPEDVRNFTIFNYIYLPACYQDYTFRIYCTKTAVQNKLYKDLRSSLFTF